MPHTKGSLIGGAAGLVAGAIVGRLVAGRERALLGLGLGALAGGGAGAGIGYGIGRPAPPPPPIRFGHNIGRLPQGNTNTVQGQGQTYGGLSEQDQDTQRRAGKHAICAGSDFGQTCTFIESGEETIPWAKSLTVWPPLPSQGWAPSEQQNYGIGAFDAIVVHGDADNPQSYFTAGWLDANGAARTTVLHLITQ